MSDDNIAPAPIDIPQIVADFRKLEWSIYETGSDEQKTLVTSLHSEMGKLAKAVGIDITADTSDVHPEALAALQPLDGGK